MLPRFSEFKRINGPDPQTGRMTQKIPYGNYPFYVKPTLWNRWLSPAAWAVWLYGGKVPGDDPEEFMARGYLISELGPTNRMGLGIEEMEADATRLKGSYGRGGCPFG